MRCGTYGEVIRVDADFKFYAQQYVPDFPTTWVSRPLCGYRYQYLGLDDVWEPERFECYADPTTGGHSARLTSTMGYGAGGMMSITQLPFFTNISTNVGLNNFYESSNMARTAHVGDITTVRDPRVAGVLGWKRLRIFPCMRINAEALHRDGTVAWTNQTTGTYAQTGSYVNEMNLLVTLPNFGYGTYEQQAGGALGESVADTDLDGMVSTGRHGKPLL
jgi:hypothetical protein